ncbi:hypothetical protein BSY48_004416 [Salmonella enterica subsp. enterica serovar Agbeni]|nr:hypothetical protein [Salmonella enterica subsp. enterica serovar Agbeni]
MKYRKLFEQIFKLDDNSPTGLVYRETGEPAGRKVKDSNRGYKWTIRAYVYPDGIKTQVQWSLARVLYELRNDVELTESDFIIYKDGNKNNLSQYNVSVSNVDKRNWQTADSFDYIILPTENPDYFKHYTEWTDPEALAMLEAEKKRRAENPLPTRGRPRKWS